MLVNVITDEHWLIEKAVTVQTPERGTSSDAICAFGASQRDEQVL
jgi:hypothetical protein